MIKQFTQDLPYKLAEQLDKEYNNRLSDIRYLISGRFDFYTPLQQDLESISMLLAMSIFYKRVISNFDSATKFTNRVLRNSDAIAIQLGTFDITRWQANKITGLILQFRSLLENYSISLDLFNYLETKEFLRKVRTLKQYLSNDNA